MKTTLLLLLLWAAPALALDPALLRARTAFANMDYERCLDELERVAKPDAATHLQRGICAFHLGQEKDAVDALTAAAKLDASLELPGSVPPRLKELCETVVRSRLPPPPQKLAPATPTLQLVAAVAPAPRRSRHVFAWTLGALAVAAAGAGVGLTLDSFDAHRLYQDSGADLAAATRLRSRAEQSMFIAQISYAGAAVAALAAVLTWVLEAP